MKTKISYSWKDVYLLAEKLADRILLDIDRNTDPVALYGVPRGGIFVAQAVISFLRAKNTSVPFVLTTRAEHADIIVDDIVDTGKTKKYYADRFLFIPFYALVELDRAYMEQNWIIFPWEEMTNEIGPEENIRRILEYIGEDPDREGLLETPKRVIKSYSKLFGGYSQRPEDILKTFEEGACDEMVLLKNIEFASCCEHHMLPFTGRAHIAYVPNGKIIGISKLARLLEIFARRLQIQERIGQQVTEAMDRLLLPHGSACILEAQHSCMTSRGVEKQNSIMCTSSLTGIFKTQPETRQELLQLIKG